MIKINKLLGTQTIDLETGMITDTSVIDCYKGGGGGTQVIYQESPQSIAYRQSQLDKENERKAEEDKIKKDAASRKADWESRQGMQSMSRSGQFKAPAQKDVGLMAEAVRQMEKGSEAQAANTAKKEVTSQQTMRGGDTSGDMGSGLGNVVEDDESGLFFKKKKAK